MPAFQISGEFITNHMRNLFLEKDFNTVFDFFKNTFDMADTEIIISILKCENKFIGINELYLEDDTPTSEENQEYLEEINYRYNQLYFENGHYYRPYAKFVICESNSIAKRWAKDIFFEHDKQLNDTIIIDGCVYSFEETLALYLCDKPNCIFKYVDHDWYALEEIDYQVPYWIEPYKNSSEFIFKFKNEFQNIYDKSVKEYDANKVSPLDEARAMELENEIYAKFAYPGILPYQEPDYELDNIISKSLPELYKYGFYENTERKVPLEEWKQQILEQTNGKFIELEYTYNNEKKTIQIPEVPFHMWCMQHDVYKLVDMGIFKWNPVCSSGIKMINDNCYHSDWVLGAGLDLENWYTNTHEETHEYNAINDAAWEYAFNYALKIKKDHGIIE